MDDASELEPQKLPPVLPRVPENPYAPTLASDPIPGFNRGYVNLPLEYWGTLGVSFLVLLGLTFATSGIAFPGLISIVLVAIRVPLWQLRHSRQRPAQPQINPIALIFTSWLVLLAAQFSTLIAFFAICLSTLVASEWLGGGQAFIFGLSGLASLIVFVLIFRLSLRLPC
ncbi:hypothetical protein [Aureliella helgolandensis]|uniref:Uncharacterized protein n=1 Tax=Aureliella helgolandensis TaxID=2527968 RepID=A0A518GHS5_9BACT|nr:hypothetical protein [Aureliella helgolandensis]QDV28080.1 hypothetical protein Q31a_64730 [Aureliella helgolandensis]